MSVDQIYGSAVDILNGKFFITLLIAGDIYATNHFKNGSCRTQCSIFRLRLVKEKFPRGKFTINLDNLKKKKMELVQLIAIYFIAFNLCICFHKVYNLIVIKQV